MEPYNRSACLLPWRACALLDLLCAVCICLRLQVALHLLLALLGPGVWHQAAHMALPAQGLQQHAALASAAALLVLQQQDQVTCNHQHSPLTVWVP